MGQKENYAALIDNSFCLQLQNLDFSLMLNGSTEAERFLNMELQILKDKMECLTQQVEEARENMLTVRLNSHTRYIYSFQP